MHLNHLKIDNYLINDENQAISFLKIIKVFNNFIKKNQISSFIYRAKTMSNKLPQNVVSCERVYTLHKT